MDEEFSDPLTTLLEITKEERQMLDDHGEVIVGTREKPPLFPLEKKKRDLKE